MVKIKILKKACMYKNENVSILVCIEYLAHKL